MSISIYLQPTFSAPPPSPCYHPLGIAHRPCGQRSHLLSDLRAILKDYNDPVLLLFELLQNADDAGATVVRFAVDGRTFRASDPPFMIGPEMAEGLINGLCSCAHAVLNAIHKRSHDMRGNVRLWQCTSDDKTSATTYK